MGYNSYLLPIPFQDLTFEVQRTLFRRFNRMVLSAARSHLRAQPSALQDARTFPPPVGRCQQGGCPACRWSADCHRVHDDVS